MAQLPPEHGGGDGLKPSALTFPTLPRLRVNERIQHSGQRGTVRYIGMLEGRGEQIWLGIEWDNPERGRHDGMVGGRQYFKTRKKSAGTFLKVEKLEQRGVYLMESVWKRYVEEAGDTGFKRERHVLGGVGGLVDFRVGEFVGRIEGLVRVDVGSMCVGRIGKGVGDVLKGLRELRVGRSLFDEMRVVGEILDEFEGLEVLDMSGNVLTGSLENGGGVHDKLKELILNGCEVSVGGVGEVCTRARKLRELRVHECWLRGLKVWTGKMEEVEMLDLDGNCVEWEDVVGVLGMMGKLKVLYLSRNGLRDCEVRFEGKFERLEKLSLAENELEGWRAVERLRGMRELKWLRLTGNKIMEEEICGVTGRMITIGRLGGLQVLDGSLIEKDERVYAERRYLSIVIERERRRIGEEALKEKHGREKELREKYRDLLGGGGTTAGVRKGLVRVVLEKRRNGSGQESKRVVRWMPGRVTMDKVHAVAERLLRTQLTGGMQIVVGKQAEVVTDESVELSRWTATAEEDAVVRIVCAV